MRRPLSRRRLAGALAAAALAAAVPAGALPSGVAVTAAVPEVVPDRLPVLSEPVRRGELVRTPAPDSPPSAKAVDGQVDDWTGRPSRIGGTSRLDAGEHVYSDFLFDAYGADDGDDAARLALLGPLADAEPRTSRADQLFQAAGDQFGAPRPVGAPDRYGDAVGGQSDLSEVRWAAEADDVHLLARVTALADPATLGLLVLADTDGTVAAAARPVGLGTGLRSRTADVAVALDAAGARVRDLATGEETLLDVPVAVVADGWTNALEAALPAALVAPDGTLRVSVVSLLRRPDATVVPANVAYRGDEPVAGVYNDQRQALALRDSDIDAFRAEVALAALGRGASEEALPGPGYHERTFTSGENIADESRREDGLLQHYGLFVPTSYRHGAATPLTTWLHYRGGKAHSGGAWTPRLLTQLGEEVGNIVVTPRGRGTSTWYTAAAHQDFFEVFADVHDLLTVDEDRRYLAGYSMGGYGTYLFGLLYPDLFAGGYSTSGAVTQGAWTGMGPDDGTCRGQCYVEANNGDANAQLAYRVLENARHLPLVIHHGTNDELVPVTGVQRMASRLTVLGYRHDMTTFTGYEHFTQAIVDEWADGAAYLQRFRRPANPSRVTYKVVPALVHATNTRQSRGVEFAFAPDGAYWVDGIVLRGGDPRDPRTAGSVDITSHAIAGPRTLPVPRAGALSPLGHSTPFTRTGLDWVEVDADLPLGEPDVLVDAVLANVAEVTLDGVRMGLAEREEVSVRLVSDGPGVVRITLPDGDLVVAVGGADPGLTAPGDRVLTAAVGEQVVRVRR